jgi:hypothetical protein
VRIETKINKNGKAARDGTDVVPFQTLQEDLTGAAFHPLDDNLLITHGKGHLTFWTRRKDGFFERTDIIKPVSHKDNLPQLFILFQFQMVIVISNVYNVSVDFW